MLITMTMNILELHFSPTFCWNGYLWVMLPIQSSCYRAFLDARRVFSRFVCNTSAKSSQMWTNKTFSILATISSESSLLCSCRILQIFTEKWYMYVRFVEICEAIIVFVMTAIICGYRLHKMTPVCPHVWKFHIDYMHNEHLWRGANEFVLLLSV